MTVEMGETYSFNKSTATVLILTADQVIWRDKISAPRINHTTPRWYFEKYATQPEQGIR